MLRLGTASPRLNHTQEALTAHPTVPKSHEVNPQRLCNSATAVQECHRQSPHNLLDGGSPLAHDSPDLAVLQDDPHGACGLPLQLVMQQGLDAVHRCVKSSTVLVLHILSGHDLQACSSRAAVTAMVPPGEQDSRRVRSAGGLGSQSITD